MPDYKPLKRDTVTWEYYCNGHWYPSYPGDEIERDERELDREPDLTEDDWKNGGR